VGKVTVEKEWLANTHPWREEGAYQQPLEDRHKVSLNTVSTLPSRGCAMVQNIKHHGYSTGHGSA